MKTPVNSAQRAAAVQRDPRWRAVAGRDAAADGKFYYAVSTTGVYCRPSCAARLARPEHVSFHASHADAERAGFRPCKRCRPNDPSLQDAHAATVARICGHIETAQHMPSLVDLARLAGMSVYHFHRVFKTVTGVTPKAYAAAHRAKRMRGELLRGGKVTDAIFEAGYNAASRFYEKSHALLGMTPTAYRAGGADTDIRYAIGTCTLGSILVAASTRGVCALWLGNNADALARDLHARFPRARLAAGDRKFSQWVARAVSLVDVPTRGANLPLDVRGTAFQQRVWQALQKIPPGATATYTQIAQRIGQPNAVRAVASACAANPLAVAIPCHRAVRVDGGLAGYRWGVARKRALLKREEGS